MFSQNTIGPILRTTWPILSMFHLVWIQLFMHKLVFVKDSVLETTEAQNMSIVFHRRSEILRRYQLKIFTLLQSLHKLGYVKVAWSIAQTLHKWIIAIQIWNLNISETFLNIVEIQIWNVNISETFLNILTYRRHSTFTQKRL